MTESLLEQDVLVAVLQLGLPDRFIDHGDPAQMLAECGLDRDGIVRAIQAKFSAVSGRRFSAGLPSY